MTGLTAEQRGDQAERLLPVAAKLACIAHGDGDHRDITHLTARRNRQELVALITLLAALVPPGAKVADLLQYVTWDEHGRPASPDVADSLTIRHLASGIDGASGLGADMVLNSERMLIARHLYVHDGLPLGAAARVVGASDPTIKKWRDAGNWQQVVITEADTGRRRRRHPAESVAS